MARVTQAHVDARRRQILDAAHRQFGLKGLEPGAATLDDIAEDAGLSKGSIYTYFADKDELVAAIREDATETDRALVQAGLDEADGAWSAFDRVARRVWDWVCREDTRERNLLSYEYLLYEVRSGAPDPENVERPVTGLTRLIEAAQRSGEITPELDSRALGTLVWNAHQGTRGYYLRTGDRDGSLAVLEVLEALLLGSSTTPSAGATGDSVSP